ncbi:MAG: Fur family transcriptional regulator [Coriobacteriia bacterium]|nr:Fur family transcriptional regulator [Coriobacteriia bacterium]
MEPASANAARMIDGCDHDVAALLRAQSLRPTKARCQLLSYLRSTDQHPNAEEITASLRSKGSDIGVATVYQNLNLLVDAGLIMRFKGADGRSRFDADLSPHSHAVCDSCGRMVDVELNEHAKRVLHGVSANESHVAGWRLNRASVELRGLCPQCRRH